MSEAVWLTGDHRAFGATVWKFLDQDYESHRARWTRERLVPHAFWEKAGELGIFAAFVDRMVEEFEGGTLTPERTATGKWWGTEMQGRIVDAGLQLHGGYGYMNEYRIAELYRDARVQRTYGGTNEIMRELIARSPDRD